MKGSNSATQSDSEANLRQVNSASVRGSWSSEEGFEALPAACFKYYKPLKSLQRLLKSTEWDIDFLYDPITLGGGPCGMRITLAHFSCKASGRTVFRTLPEPRDSLSHGTLSKGTRPG